MVWWCGGVIGAIGAGVSVGDDGGVWFCLLLALLLQLMLLLLLLVRTGFRRTSLCAIKVLKVLISIIVRSKRKKQSRPKGRSSR